MLASCGTAGSLSWLLDGVTEAGAWPRLQLVGEIDENVDLDALLTHLTSPIELDLTGIHRVNSCGVRVWIRFIRLLESQTKVRLVRCSPSVVNQLNTISNFRGAAEVLSFWAPYVCQKCGLDELKLLDVRSHFALVPRALRLVAPAFPCDACGDALVLDELPERYLAFLVELDADAAAPGLRA